MMCWPTCARDATCFIPPLSEIPVVLSTGYRRAFAVPSACIPQGGLCFSVKPMIRSIILTTPAGSAPTALSAESMT